MKCPFCTDKFKQPQPYVTHLWTAHAIRPEHAPLKTTDRSFVQIVSDVEGTLGHALILPDDRPVVFEASAHVYGEECLCPSCINARFDRTMAEMDKVLA